ncbi:helix-turn-helix domain-containing protein [candidate division WOR-3 bacterium]|nr:helix-turn-helix domain-containing protein [candidate division WOR-3 bacterium]
MRTDRSLLAGLPELFRAARLRAGLSQTQVAEAIGMEPRSGRTYVSRLERGQARNPTLGVVVGFLRACRADPAEVGEAFKRWLANPLPVPERKAAPRARTHHRKEDKADLELRRQAAWYTLAQVLEHFLHHEFRALGLAAGEQWRTVGARLARRTFRILYEARGGDGKSRERRLNRARAWAVKKTLPGELIEHLGARVAGLFQDMEKDGDLEWLPSLDDARKTMATSPGERVLTDEQMCRAEWMAQKAKEHAAFEQKYEPIMEKAKALLRQAGLADQQAGNYLAFVTAFTNVARSTRPGSDERAKAVELQLRFGLRKWHNPALVDRIAQLVMSAWDEPDQPSGPGTGPGDR